MANDDLSRREVLTGVTIAGAAVVLPGCAGTTTHPAPVGEKAVSVERSAGDAPPPGTVPVTLSVNGKDHPINLEPRVTLLDALRERIGLTGTKKGCDHGQCGACTVLLDDRRVNSCLLLAVMAQGKKITTIEGLADADQLHPVQAAFIGYDAFQCGYCTPGQICSAVGLLYEGRYWTDEEIREGMSGNLCRCGAYPNIVEAVKHVMREE